MSLVDKKLPVHPFTFNPKRSQDHCGEMHPIDDDRYANMPKSVSASLLIWLTFADMGLSISGVLDASYA